MKLYFAGALVVLALNGPVHASSIELIDEMVTGAKGSIVTFGEAAPCEEGACVDKSGGDPKLSTGAAQQQAALNAAPLAEINFAFARKYPDPAVPIPAAMPNESGEVSEEIPLAPADSGSVPAQPPVEQPTEQASMVPQEAAATDDATVDPKAPLIPLADSELRDGE